MAEPDVEEIVRRVLGKLGREGSSPGAGPAPAAPAAKSPGSGGSERGWFVSSPGGAPGGAAAPVPPPAKGGGKLQDAAAAAIREGVASTMDEAVTRALEAQKKLLGLGLAKREALIAQMRVRFKEAIPFMAELAVAETGLGRYQDKVAKNHLAAEKTPGVEDVRPEAFTGDYGLTVVERAPLGLIGSITPMTNPSETIVNNSICLIAGGNAVVFNPHPSARLISLFAISLLNRAVVEAGGPPDLVMSVREPSLESSGELMKHPGIRTLLVTGGGAVVDAAMKSGKRAICAGPGNPPVVVDETADLRSAARHITAGCSLDNNIVCIAEKEVLVVQKVADELMRELEAAGNYRVPASRMKDLEGHVFPDGKLNRKLIGKNAGVILGGIGIKADDSVRVAFCEVDFDHPLVQTEQLMPVLPIVRVPDVDKAIALAVKAEHGYNHTAMMHSRDLEALDHMARSIQVSIFVKNGPCAAGLGLGGEGFSAWSIAGKTGEGMTRPRTFTRERRCVLKDYFRIV